MWYYTWNGTAFTGVNTGAAYDSTAAQYQLADVDGDGLPDLVSLYNTYSSTTGRTQITVYVRLNTSAGGTAGFSSTNTLTNTIGSTGGGQLLTPDGQYGSLRRFDFDGDGRDDLAIEVVTGTAPNYTVNTYEMLSIGTGFRLALISTLAGSTYPHAFFTNGNDDACTDFVALSTLYVSACNGTTATTLAVGNVVAAMDWDGDGRTDLVVSNGTTLGVYLSTGDGISALQPTSILYSTTCQYVTMDANADGLDDLGCWSQTTPGSVSYRVHNGANQPPDLAVSIVDGYGLSAKPTYVPLPESFTADGDPSVPHPTTYMSDSFNAASYPYMDYMGPLYVVSQVLYTDPSNAATATYTQTFYYDSAWQNLQGRGFAGFSQTNMDDSRTGWRTYAGAGQTFPYSGMPGGPWYTDPNGSSVYQRYHTRAVTVLDATANNQRYFPYVSDIFEIYGEPQPNTLGWITTKDTAYTFDNYGNALTTTTTLTDSQIGSPYANEQWTSTTTNTFVPDTATWCLNMPTETVVTNTGPSVPAITRTVNLTPDYTYCREAAQSVEPNSTLYNVQTSYLVDAFGNVNKQTVTGVGMAPRVTNTTWGASGQFPTQVTNPLGQVSSPSYDPSTGFLASLKDANGITTTSRQYDPFQRKVKETRPDNTSTTWAYDSCATAGCVNANNRMTVIQTQVNTDGTALRTSNVYLDALDRTLVTSEQQLSGAYNRVETQYDSMGRPVKIGMPCTFVGCTQYWMSNSFDILNRITVSQRPISATDATLQSTTYAYQGRTRTITDPQGKITTQISRVTGNVARTQDHNGYAVIIDRDAFGSVLSTTDSLSNTLQTQSYAYGIAPFVISSSDMDLGNRTYTVDALGELTAYSDAKGAKFAMTYDGLSRPLVRTESDLTTTWTWGATASSHNIGRLQQVASMSSTGNYLDTYTYDADGRLADRSLSIPGDGLHAFDYTYNATTGLLNTLTYPASASPATYRLTALYAYKYGTLQSIADAATPSTVWWQNDATNSRGQITQETTSALAADPKLVTNRAYDAVTGWLSTVQTGSGSGAALQNESYLYDYVGNVTQREDNNAGLTEKIYYDNLYRLDHSVLGSTTNLQMGYDAMGNITSRTDVAAGAAWTYDPTHKHQVTEAGSPSFTYTYDANGNAKTRNGTTIDWSTYNYPTSIGTSTESATFDYGPDRQRWRMVYTSSAGSETTYTATPLFERVVTAAGSDYRHYLYAAGRPVILISRTTAGAVNVRSLLTDHQGSISAIVTDATGSSLIKESFTAYGNRRNAATWSGAPTTADLTTINGVTREGYTFQTVLGSMGLNHMNGRVQDAVTGRFLSPDSFIPTPSNTQSYNRYAYANNNPLSYTDPSGHSPYKRCIDICSAQGSGKQNFDPGSLLGFSPPFATVSDGTTGSVMADFDDGSSASSSGNDSSNLSDIVVTAQKIPTASGDTTSSESPQSQNGISMAPSVDGINPVVVVGHYIDAPNDLSQQAAGFNYAALGTALIPYNPGRAAGQFLAVGAGGGALAAVLAPLAPAAGVMVRGPAMGALMEMSSSSMNTYAAQNVLTVIETEGYAEFLEGVNSLGEALKSLEVPEVNGPEIPWR